MAETMTGRERFLKALRRGIPDRVPIFELMIDPHVIEGLIPGASYPDFVEKVGLDCVVTPTPSALYKQTIIGYDGPDVAIIKTEWGETRAKTVELVPIPVEHPVSNREDWARYKIPDPHVPGRMDPLKALVARFRGRKAVGMHLHDAFSYPSYILGMANLFVQMYEDPDLVTEIVAACVDHSIEMIRNAAREGADFIVLGDDYGGKSGPMMSPAHFERFFLPGLARVVQEAKRLGLYVIKHTDGNVYSILGQMVDAGIDAFHPSDPGAGMDIVKVKQMYGDRICVVGGIDTGAPLSHWSVDELVAEVRRRIRELAPGGGWIISSSNTVHASAKPENYGALVWATRTYGQYDNLDQPSPVPDLEGVLPFTTA